MIYMPKLFLFALLSALAVAASLHAWRTRQAYGFYRFFAFECLALLITWNAGHWFHDPFSRQQIASWTLFVVGTALAAHGSYLLRAVGMSQRRVIEETRTLVEVGVYRYIRHPLYASLMIFAWGVYLKGVDWASAILALAASAFLAATARNEEEHNINRFGGAYSEYMDRTKMFIPFLL